MVQITSGFLVDISAEKERKEILIENHKMDDENLSSISKVSGDPKESREVSLGIQSFLILQLVLFM